MSRLPVKKETFSYNATVTALSQLSTTTNFIPASGYSPRSSSSCTLGAESNSAIAASTKSKKKALFPAPKGERCMSEMGFAARPLANELPMKPPKRNLYDIIRMHIQHNEHLDIEVRIGNHVFYCHRMVLQAYSQYFSHAKLQPVMVLPEKSITKKGFLAAYSWMLAEDPQIQRDGFMELYQACVFLHMTELHMQLWSFLDDPKYFKEDTAYVAYQEAGKYALKDVQDYMLQRVSRVFLTVVATREFLDMPMEEVCKLLQMDTIGVHTELDVLMTVVRWLNHDWQEREKHALSLANCIRFQLLEPVFLMSLSKGSDSTEIQRFVRIPGVLCMVTDALTYVTVAEQQKRPVAFLRVLENVYTQLPTKRFLVEETKYDKIYQKCCENLECTSYEAFLQYLNAVRAVGAQYWRTLRYKQLDMRSSELIFKKATQQLAYLRAHEDDRSDFEQQHDADKSDTCSHCGFSRDEDEDDDALSRGVARSLKF